MDFQDSRIKLLAAEYFYGQIKNLYNPGMSGANFSNNIFFVCDALIWELYAAFDLSLFVINQKQNLGFTPYNVKWDIHFQEKLKKENLTLYSLLRSAQEKLWFKHLKKARRYITHHGQIYLSIDYNNQTINVASIGTPGILSGDGSIDLLDQTKRWIASMNIFLDKITAQA
ncbi:MAG TPA: hypothetical protein VFB59_05475 [Candidatus Saccharimonadales bacterium]|nr:hypothetical protein [Candidatus Saccharimonadales bacterium]